MNKVTIESIKAKIASVICMKLSPKITHCIITLENGFQVTGESACVDPENYNQEIGEKIAYENAFDKIWLLEGYLLQENLFQEKYKSEVFTNQVATGLPKSTSLDGCPFHYCDKNLKCEGKCRYV